MISNLDLIGKIAQIVTFVQNSKNPPFVIFVLFCFGFLFLFLFFFLLNVIVLFCFVLFYFILFVVFAFVSVRSVLGCVKVCGP